MALATEAAPASTPAASEPEKTDVGAPPFYFAVLAAAAVIGAAHEVLFVEPALYVAEDRGLIGVTGLGGAAFGALVAKTRRPDAFAALPWALGLASLATALSGPACFFAWARGEPTFATALGSALAVGATLGASATLALSALGLTLLRLDAPWRLANPFRLLAVALACGAAAGVTSVVGPLRAAAAIGMVLAALGIWAPELGWFLERRAIARGKLARLVLLGAFAAYVGLFIACEWLVPVGALQAYPNPVVFHRETERGRYAVTVGQEATELWIDGKLKASTLDERRYFEALVHPALTLAPRKQRILLLGGGTGLAEREILRHPEVGSLTVVVVDRALVELSDRQRWLSRLAQGSLRSAKVRVIEREPILWLGETDERFDVAVIDLPDPETHVEGKNFTRFFFRRLRERLTPEGLCVVQGTSAFASPRSFDSVIATLAAAELHPVPYRAPVPSLGDWGFALGFVQKPARVSFEAAAPYLSGASPGELAHLPPDTRPSEPGRPATLHDQSIVEELHKEQR